MYHDGYILVVDGPDASGKSTLCDKIKEVFPSCQYFHNTYSKGLDIYNYHLACVKQAIRLKNQGYLVVIDRLWLSEFVYGNIFRRGAGYPASIVKMFNDNIDLNVLAITEDLNVIVNNFRKTKSERFEMFDSMEEIAKMYHSIWFGKYHPEYDNYKNKRFDNQQDLIFDVIRAGGFSKDKTDKWFRYGIMENDPQEVIDIIKERWVNE